MAACHHSIREGWQGMDTQAWYAGENGERIRQIIDTPSQAPAREAQYLTVTAQAVGSDRYTQAECLRNACDARIAMADGAWALSEYTDCMLAARAASRTYPGTHITVELHD